MKLHFQPVGKNNRTEIEKLQIFPAQVGFIESVSECLNEADHGMQWKPVGIYDDQLLIGFAMYGYFQWPLPGQLWLDRLIIDKNYQGKGYGKAAVRALLEKLRQEYGSEAVYLSVYEDNAAAIHLYLQIGFCFNGAYDTKGEKIMVYLY